MFKQEEVVSEKENIVFLKLENDIDMTEANKSGEIEAFWSSINGLQSKNESPPTFSFEIVSDNNGASFYLGISEKFERIVRKKLNAVYPFIEITNVDDPLIEMDKRKEDSVYTYELQLSQHESFSLKTKGTEKTFINNLLNSMNHFGEDEISCVQITMRPLSEKWNMKAEKTATQVKKGNYVKNPVAKSLLFTLDMAADGAMSVLDIFVTKGDMKKSFSKKAPTVEKHVDKENKFKKPCFNVSIKIATKSIDPVIAEQTAKSISTVFKELNDENSFLIAESGFELMKDRKILSKNNAISTLELSQFALLPSKNVSADNVTKGSVKMPYDKNIPSKGIVFGYLPQSNNRKVAFPMIPISVEKYQDVSKEYEKIIDNICKPRLVLGQMGTGKSEWIINYTISLINMGLSVVLVDPKSDTQKRLIESIPDKHKDKIDYLNLGDLIFPPSLNLLRRRNPGDTTEVSLIVQTLISFFKKEFGRSWGFAMQQLIMMTGNAILLDEIASLYEFQLMITNQEYRAKMIHKIEDLLDDKKTTGKTMLKELLSFWKHFHSMEEKDQSKRIASTMNKIGVFMSNRIIRAIVSQENSYDFRKAGDNGKITIVNIPDGELGDENVKLLASFINKAIWLDFRSRANISIEKRYPTMWLIEEAHMVMDEEFIPVLTQSRGYRLGVTILTQGLTNFKNKGMEELKDLILTNCKNKIIFRVGPDDARILAEEFAPLTRFDLMNCPDYHFYSKILLEGGKVSDIFFAHALDMAPNLRNYDEYKDNHRSGRLTIDQIEDQLDDRHKLTDLTTILNLGDLDLPLNEDERPTRKKKVALEFL